MTDQTVRLVFLGEAGAALRATDTVTTGVKRLSQAEKEQAASTRQLRAETAASRREFQGFERDLSKTVRGAVVGTGVFRGMGRAVAFASGTFLGGYGLAYAVRVAFDEMQNAAKVGAQTRQVILTTGGAAGVTARQVDVLAKATMRKAGIDDEAVKTAENMLLTFTEIRNELGRGNDIFTQATKLTVDLSVALGQDLRSSAIQVGKALQDPLTGLTALRRVGVSFTASQREQIKALVQSGQIVQAQKIILAALATQFGGTAAKANEATGGIGTLREEIRNLGAEYLNVLKPDIQEAVKAGEQWVQHLEEDKKAQKELRDDVKGAVTAIREMAHVLHTATDAVGGTKSAIELLIGLKVLAWAAEMKVALATVIGSEVAGAEAGLLGGATAAATFRSRLVALTAKPWVVALGLALIPTSGAGQNDPNLPGAAKLLAQLPIIGGLFSQMNELGLKIDKLLGIYDYGYNGQQPGTNNPPPGGSPSAALTSGGGVKIPTHFKATHQTAGLAGFPAVDIMAKPGTPIKAPEDGHITRVSGREPSEAPPQGQGGPWGLSIYFVGADTGNTYYMTHLMKVGGLGFYKKGATIGIIGDYPGSSADHVHVGIHQGASSQATIASGLFNPADYDLSGGSKAPPRRRPPRSGSGSRTDLPLNLQEALAAAGTTTGKADDRSALQAIIAFLKADLARGGLTQTQRIDLLNQEGSYIDQLASLTKTKKGPAGASKSSLIVIKNTLAEVAKLVDQAGLSKKFDRELGKINDLLDKKLVTTATLAKIRIKLGKIGDAAKTAIDKAKEQVEKRKQAFSDAWAKLAEEAFAAFDKETADHVGPTRAILNKLVGEHEQHQIKQAVDDAKKALDEALAGKNDQADSDILARVRDLVGRSALANAIDKAQSQVLGINPAEVGSGSLIGQLQQLLAPGAGTVDQQAVADAQRAYDEALYNQKVFDTGKLADLEDSQYATMREQLRGALESNLAAWEAYYLRIGEKASNAAADFARVWAGVLAQFPVRAGGTNPFDAPTVNRYGSLYVPTGVVGHGFGGSFASGGIVPGLLGQPKLILAHGGERVLTPAQQTSGGVEHTMLHLSLGEPLDQMVEAKVMRLTPQISVAIGADASRRARSGRF